MRNVRSLAFVRALVALASGCAARRAQHAHVVPDHHVQSHYAPPHRGGHHRGHGTVVECHGHDCDDHHRR